MVIFSYLQSSSSHLPSAICSIHTVFTHVPQIKTIPTKLIIPTIKPTNPPLNPNAPAVAGRDNGAGLGAGPFGGGINDAGLAKGPFGCEDNGAGLAKGAGGGGGLGCLCNTTTVSFWPFSQLTTALLMK